MNCFRCIAAALLAAVACCAAAANAPPPAPHHHDMADMEAMAPAVGIPGASLYRLPVTLEDSSGATRPLAQWRGAPLLVTMFYSHCTSVCPLLTSQLQRVYAALSPAAQGRVRVLMVSLDPGRDTPAALAQFRAGHHIDSGRWVVARATPGDVRMLAAALGIRYRELPDHSFNHSTLITLLDADGVARARTTIIAADDPEFVASIE